MPSYQWIISRTRLSTQANDFITALNLARSEAVKRGVRVTVCKTADPAAASPTCTTSGGFQQGWIVFVDNTQVTGNTAGTIDATVPPDVRLRVFGAIQGSTLVNVVSVAVDEVSDGVNFANWISYLPSGRSRGAVGGLANGTFRLCNSGKGRSIVVNTAGRVSVKEVASC
jgi:type IV fimbrial biogenesis protein FimT